MECASLACMFLGVGLFMAGVFGLAVLIIGAAFWYWGRRPDPEDDGMRLVLQDACGILLVYRLPRERSDGPVESTDKPTFGSRFQRDNVFELIKPGEELPTKMQETAATGIGLSTNGNLGADMIRVEGGDAFPMHTHPGDHLLYVVKGRGTVTIGGVLYNTEPGDIYMVPGLVEHSVGAVDEHFLLSIGSPHRPADQARHARRRLVLREPDGEHVMLAGGPPMSDTKADEVEVRARICTYDPKPLLGQPIGQFHCPTCGCMVVAGIEHGVCLPNLCPLLDLFILPDKNSPGSQEMPAGIYEHKPIGPRTVVDGKKRCNGCGEWLPADEEHFRYRNREGGWFQPRCRSCENVDTLMRARGRRVALAGEPPTVCYLCGVMLDWDTAELDRIDPGANGGKYVAGNCAWTCSMCNQMKNGLTLNALRAWMSRIEAYHFSGEGERQRRQRMAENEQSNAETAHPGREITYRLDRRDAIMLGLIEAGPDDPAV